MPNDLAADAADFMKATLVNQQDIVIWQKINTSIERILIPH